MLNLKAHPSVTVTMGGRDRPMTARAASAEEKAELWPQAGAVLQGLRRLPGEDRREILPVILELDHDAQRLRRGAEGSEGVVDPPADQPVDLLGANAAVRAA